jgi:type II secretion system protein J
LRTTRSASNHAFTLLELLIATAVGAIVLLVVQTTYFGALRLHNTTHDRIEEDLALQRALAIIRRDLAGLMLPGSTLAGHLQTENFSSFTGESFGDRVGPDLYTNSGRVDGWNPFSDVQRVTYYLATATPATTGKAKNLLRVVERNLLPVQESTGGEDQVLLEGVESASLSFYDGSGWIDTWDSEATSTLPKALKLSIVMAATGASQAGQAPIDIVVPILVRTTTAQREEEEEAAGTAP